MKLLFLWLAWRTRDAKGAQRVLAVHHCNDVTDFKAASVSSQQLFYRSTRGRLLSRNQRIDIDNFSLQGRYADRHCQGYHAIDPAA